MTDWGTDGSVHRVLPLPAAVSLTSFRHPMLADIVDNSGWQAKVRPFPPGSLELGTVPVGGVTLLLGANGAGKSTVLEALAACLRGASSGRTRIEDIHAAIPVDAADLWEAIEAHYGWDDVQLREHDIERTSYSSVSGSWEMPVDGGDEASAREEAGLGTPSDGLSTSGRGWFSLFLDRQELEGPTGLLPWAHRVAYFPPRLLSMDDELAAAVGLASPSPHGTPGRQFGIDGLGLAEDGSVAPGAATAAGALSRAINKAAPRFIQMLGEFEVVVHDAMRRLRGAAPVELRLHVGDGGYLPLEDLSSGQQRWLQITVAITGLGLRCRCERFEQDGVTYDTVDNPDELLVLIDEPELHLHPYAQQDITEWVQRLHGAGVRFVMATHSPRLLDIDHSITHLIKVTGGQTLQVEELDDDALSVIDSYGTELGLGRDALYSVLAGVLVVEGIDDQRVLHHFYGPQLRHNRILVMPIHGTRNASNAGILELLADLDTQIHIMFDKLGDSTSTEMKSARRAADRLRELGHEPMMVPFPGPDILTGIQLESIAEAWPQHRERIDDLTDGSFDWAPLLAQHEHVDGQNFKGWFMEQLGRTHATEAMRDLIDRIEQLPDAAPTPALDGPMAAVLTGHVFVDIDAFTHE